MFPFVLSPEALQDLQDIWDFIAADNVKAADKLEDEFFEAFERLTQHPGMGHVAVTSQNAMCGSGLWDPI